MYHHSIISPYMYVSLTAIAISNSISVNIRLVHSSYDFFQLWAQGFLARGAEVVQTKIILHSAYTSVIKQSLLKWNENDCVEVSMHDAIQFNYCHVAIF